MHPCYLFVSSQTLSQSVDSHERALVHWHDRPTVRPSVRLTAHLSFMLTFILLPFQTGLPQISLCPSKGLLKSQCSSHWWLLLTTLFDRDLRLHAAIALPAGDGASERGSSLKIAGLLVVDLLAVAVGDVWILISSQRVQCDVSKLLVDEC